MEFFMTKKNKTLLGDFGIAKVLNNTRVNQYYYKIKEKYIK